MFSWISYLETPSHLFQPHMIPSPLELQHQYHKDGHQYQLPEQLNHHQRYDKDFNEISESKFKEKNLKRQQDSTHIK